MHSALGEEGSFSLYHLAGFSPQPVEWVLDISYYYDLGILFTKFPAAVRGLECDALRFLSPPVVCQS